MYNFKEIEAKWQKKWEGSDLYKAKNFAPNPKYILVEFPYPSGDGLHVGHCRSYTALDIVARKSRMEGFNVLYPMGWDAFGLPTENYAIKTGRHPAEVTRENTDNFRRQMKSLGFSFDWSREINTTDPEYYKWTQWIFLQFYKAGLAYKMKMPINWCPKDKIGLANEEVVNGKCERCGTEVVKKEMEQWMLKITAYADKLLAGLDEVNFPERVKEEQRNWIGKSEGAEVEFSIKNSDEKIKVFTTRLDTIFGVSAVVLAPEHPLVGNLNFTNKKEVEKYINAAKNKSDLERTEEKEKTGVELKGVKAVNPFTNEEVAVWAGDYVLAGYGTGAVMIVPAHDERDFAFAKKYGLSVRDVVLPKRIDTVNPSKAGKKRAERRMVHGIIRDPKTGNFLILKWKKFPWTTFVLGGVEDGENIVEAAKREIAEETGYADLKFKKVLGGPVYSEYYAAHKDENRVATVSAVFFELASKKKTEVAAEELEKHEPEWVTKDELKTKVSPCSELDVWLARLERDGAYTEDGVLHDSGEFTGLDSADARKKMAALAKKKKFGDIRVNYHLRDWVFSRQHYWGEPIPIVYCDKCGEVAVPEKDLPVRLPEVERYEPTDTGESPLAAITDWVNTKCPKCNGVARRETDTMPNWAGSSWYFLRYTDPENNKTFASKKLMEHWLPIDIYNGGMEHTTLHLLYSRFWNRFLYDQNLVPFAEPYQRRTSHGMVLGEGGIKMSKSRGNVINPDKVVEEYGADTLRVYEMFMGPFGEAIPWDTKSLVGAQRFLEKAYNLVSKSLSSDEGRIGVVEKKFSTSPNPSLSKEGGHDGIKKLLHKTIKGVTEDIDAFKFNTAISKLMILVNAMSQEKELRITDYGLLITILAPFAPHLSEGLWEKLGNKNSIFKEKWPEYDPKLAKDDEIELVIQINGKVRDKITVAAGISEDEAKKLAMESEKIKVYAEGKEIRKIIFTGKLLNIVV